MLKTDSGKNDAFIGSIREKWRPGKSKRKKTATRVGPAINARSAHFSRRSNSANQTGMVENIPLIQKLGFRDGRRDPAKSAAPPHAIHPLFAARARVRERRKRATQ